MFWQNTSFFIPLISVIFMAVIGIFYIWICRKGLQDIIGIGIMVLSIICISSYILQQSITLNNLKVLFDKIQYTGTILLPVGLFLLVAKYVNFNKIFKLKYILLISAFPIITLFLVLTNEFHRLIWVNANLVLFDSFNLIVKEYNTLYFVFIFYSSILTLTGIIISIVSIIKSYKIPDGQSRWKKLLLIPYVSIPWLIILVKYLGFNPFPYIHEVPIITIVCTLAIITVLNKTRIREIMPVALETIFENMDDGLILVDSKENVLKLNSASQKIFKTPLNNIAGKSVNCLLTGLDENPDVLLGNEDLKIGNNGSQCFYNTRQTELKNNGGKPLGKVIVLRDITEIRKAEEQIKYLSFYDKLTGAYNRAFFDIEFKRLNAQRQMPLSLVIGDVNGLKIINDAFGHAYGDELLRKIAEILKSCFRKEDIVSRWGGDEFSILLPRTSHSTTMQIVERVHKKCMEHSTNTMLVSISMGVATKEKSQGDTEELLKEAEDRMYRHKLMENRSARSSIIASLEKALEEKDFETEEHTKRMKKYSLLFGQELKLSDSKLDELSLLSTLHDIGKIGIPDNIILKPGKLNKNEWQIMKQHSEIGYRIASSNPDLAHIAKSILHHHERWDGGGYPYGLSEFEIPMTSRVISIIDAYDAMVNDRPYRKALPKELAIEEINKCSGSQFDPALVDIFMNQLLVKECVS